MLYGLGIVLLLASGAFVGGSTVVPTIVAALGISLMLVGKRPEAKHETE